MEKQLIMYRRPTFEADVSGFVKPYTLYVRHYKIMALTMEILFARESFNTITP
ncbi:hypothetical protein E2C01_095086 [Portunus trituberculatus]|uniref:Uncharacterized protein n=1 Tax=Portunus trituberculatus TaxID=210409 RepID=A0A5B7K3C7_PORTR|nr:hypothetical protein [Portunus trituberculatus]